MEERRLRLFENRVLRRTFGTKRDEVTVECRKLHTEETIDLYSPNIIRVKNEMGEACRTYGGRLVVHTGFWWGNLRVKRPFGKPRRRRKDNIKMKLQEVECGAWTGLVWLRKGIGGGLL
jgi:hypothetical protein